MTNGAAQRDISAPAGDPNLMRLTQYYSELARDGKIVGVAIIGITPTGDVYSSDAFPAMPAMLNIAIGALSCMIIDLNEKIKAFKKQTAPSAIIRPTNGLRAS